MKYLTLDGELVDENCEDCTIPFYKTPTNHDTLADAKRCGTEINEPSKTDQSFKDDADINLIIERMKKGQEPVLLPAHFGEQPTLDLYEARMRIAESNATFYNLDPEIREEFQNDPARWERQVLKDLETGNVENLNRMGIAVEKPPAAAPVGSPAPGPQGAEGVVSATPETAPKTEGGK